ncbi:MAG: hypothetical protein JWN84_4112 [Nocardioides sp.]|nr:hypothetical protein [Nocardioides sp.]
MLDRTVKRQGSGVAGFLKVEVAATLVRLLRLVLPARRVAVVISGVPTEGNAVEVVRRLLSDYSGRVVWLDGPSDAFCVAQGLASAERQPRYSRAGVLAYLTAEAVFITHGAFGMPRTVPRKLTVNLWHGSGMKTMPQGLLLGPTPRGPAADLLVSAARVWGEYYADLSGVARHRVVYSGNPRVDAFARPLDQAALAGLGVTAPFVLWMPTFRTSTGGSGWSDSTAPDSAEVLRSLAVSVAEACRERGIGLVVKAHPLDAELRDLDGAVGLTDDLLQGRGVALYELLGAAVGLLTDASSVWTDYLLLDRPIGFVFPDHEAYRSGRGVHPPDIMDWLPGEMLVDRPTIERFLDVLSAGGGVEARHLRARTANRIGLAVPAVGATSALFERLEQTGTAFARALRGPADPRPPLPPLPVP